MLHADACVVRCHGGAFAPQQVGGFVVGGSGAAVVLVGLDADVGHGVGVGGGVGIGIVGVEGVLVGDVLPGGGSSVKLPFTHGAFLGSREEVMGDSPLAPVLWAM